MDCGRNRRTAWLELRADAIGEPVTAAWCDPCALPSVMEQDFVISLDRTTLRRITYRECQDCGRAETVRHRATL